MIKIVLLIFCVFSSKNIISSEIELKENFEPTSKEQQKEKNKKLFKAVEEHIDNKKYKEAITILNTLIRENQENKKILRAAHFYRGSFFYDGYNVIKKDYDAAVYSLNRVLLLCICLKNKNTDFFILNSNIKLAKMYIKGGYGIKKDLERAKQHLKDAIANPTIEPGLKEELNNLLVKVNRKYCCC